MAKRKSAMLTDAEHKKLWEDAGPIEIRMVEKNEKCKHDLPRGCVLL